MFSQMQKAVVAGVPWRKLLALIFPPSKITVERPEVSESTGIFNPKLLSPFINDVVLLNCKG